MESPSDPIQSPSEMESPFDPAQYLLEMKSPFDPIQSSSDPIQTRESPSETESYACCVCLEESDYPCTIMPCGHTVGFNCLEKLSTSSSKQCPTCRGPIEKYCPCVEMGSRLGLTLPNGKVPIDPEEEKEISQQLQTWFDQVAVQMQGMTVPDEGYFKLKSFAGTKPIIIGRYWLLSITPDEIKWNRNVEMPPFPAEIDRNKVIQLLETKGYKALVSTRKKNRGQEKTFLILKKQHNALGANLQLWASPIQKEDKGVCQLI